MNNINCIDRNNLIDQLERLLLWHDQIARPLPWKENITPYRVWVSEIMLQQTQVATVVEDYFERFVERLPGIHALAEADEQTVLQLWEGLGYYSRARNLHKAARLIIDQYDGRFPDSVDIVASLPGIGRYTAGAIISIAYGKPAPILEANTIRVHARLNAIGEDVSKSSVQNILWEEARKWVEVCNSDNDHDLVKNVRPGKINQALMELGQLVCRKTPQCDVCPLQSQCRAFLTGCQNEIPMLKPPIEVCPCHHASIIITDKNNRIFCFRHTNRQRWFGLWDFPRFDLTPPAEDPLSDRNQFFNDPDLKIIAQELTTALPAGIHRLYGLDVHIDEIPFYTFRHSVTRYRIELSCYLAELCTDTKASEIKMPEIKAPDTNDESGWFTLSELITMPLTAPARKIVSRLEHTEK